MPNIAIIGIDGSGKTSLAKRIFEFFDNEGISVCIARSSHKNSSILNSLKNIYGLEIPEKIKMNAYYFDFLKTYYDVNYFDDNHKLIIWDRYFFCLEAYFSIEGIIDQDWVEYVSNLSDPDITILLDIDASEAIKRLENRGDRKEKENYEFLSGVRRKYLELSRKNNWYIVNSTNIDFTSLINLLKNKLLLCN